MAEMDQEAIQDQPQADESTVTAANDDQTPLYNKVQMADVIKRERQKALEKGKQLAMEELQQQQQQAPQQQQPQAPAQPQSMGGMQQMSPEQIRQMISEESAKQMQAQSQHNAMAQKAQGFVQKMETAEEKHPGMRAKLEKLDWTHMGPVVKLLDDAPNAGDIMRELLDHPMKMGNIVTLAHTQPHLAAQAMQELASSIAQNTQAKAQEAQASEPLGQLTPSNIGSDTGRSGSVRDFKNKYRG